jgi:hypothetical protein
METTMARSTTGEEIPPYKTSPRLPADHPLFRRGFVIGMKRAADFRPSRGELPSPMPNEPVDGWPLRVDLRGSVIVMRTAGIAASSSSPHVPAKVSSQNAERPLSLGRREPLKMPEAVGKRSRANKAQNCFLYCPSSDRGNSAIRLYIDEIEEDFLRSDRMRVLSHSLAPFPPFVER